MELFQAVGQCFTKYATFSGRASRSEYWNFHLFLFIAFPFIIIFFVLPILFLIVLPVFFIPSLAACVRRLHDVDRSGWWSLIGATVIGWVLLFYWLVKESDIGPNRFGEDPLEKLAEARKSTTPSKDAKAFVFLIFAGLIKFHFFDLLIIGLIIHKISKNFF